MSRLMGDKKDRPKRRIWLVRVIVVDQPPLNNKTKKQEKFLTKKELLESIKVQTGYACVTPSVVYVKMELTSSAK